MAHAMRSTVTSNLLATDGRIHPLQDTLLIVTLVLGGIAAITSIFNNLHLLSSWAGLVGILTGGYGQFVSVTTRQRTGLVIGMGASGLGLLIGMAHGGLFGGVVG